jgi:phenylpyruvate tautomerase PptA (4-oxalocrotonate tautomerase family)
MVIQITEQSRDRDQKEALYRTLPEQLHAAIGLRPEDLIVALVASKLEDWSFGLGRAQFLTGELGSVHNV